MELCCQADWNSDGVVVKFLLAEQEARDSFPNLTTTISEIGYLTIWLKYHQSGVNPKNGVIPIVPLLYKTSKIGVGQSGFWEV